MPYQPHTLVTIGGTLAEQAADDEVWQCGIRGFADGGGPIDASKLADLALAVLRGPTGSGGGMEGIWGNADSGITTDAKLAWCKAANIGPDGKYTAEPGIAQMTPVAGTKTSSMPSFCSVAISWSTGKTLGKAVRGRIYLPNYGMTRSTGSTISSTTAGLFATWAVGVLQAFDTSLATDPATVFHPFVVSESGVSNVITGLRVGNVIDTQRRRKDAVSEVYVSRTFTP